MIFILKTLIKWRVLIVSSAILTAALAAVVSLVLPKWYTATTSVFPPETKSFLGSYADAVQSLQLPIFGPNAIGARPSTIYIDILKSRTLGEKIVNEYDLKGFYGTTLMTDAITALQSHMGFSLLENGLLKISYEDRDPERAASIANRLVKLLDEYNRQINITRAAKTKEFIASQIEVHARDLEEAEEELKAFQEKHQALELGEQIRASIEIVADLTAEAIALEVDLEILRQYASQNSEEYVRKKKQYDGILGQIEKFKIDATREEDDLVRSYFPSFEKVPEIGLDLARLTRRVKVEGKIFEVLIQEYEKARIEEARDTPTVQILDNATVPELRSRPKRKALVVLGAGLGLGWSALIVLFVTVWREDKDRSGALQDILRPITTDLRRLFRKGQ